MANAKCFDFSILGQSDEQHDIVLTSAGDIWNAGQKNVRAAVGGCLQTRLMDTIDVKTILSIHLVDAQSHNGKKYLLYKFKDMSEAWFQIDSKNGVLFNALNEISITSDMSDLRRSAQIIRRSKIRKLDDIEKLRQLLDQYTYHSRGFFPEARGSGSIVNSTLFKIKDDAQEFGETKTRVKQIIEK
jgi:hypothetical protein